MSFALWENRFLASESCARIEKLVLKPREREREY